MESTPETIEIKIHLESGNLGYLTYEDSTQTIYWEEVTAVGGISIPGTKRAISIKVAGTKYDPSSKITVLGSRANVKAFVGHPKFNVFPWEKFPKDKLNEENAKWLLEAIRRGDRILLVTDPDAHRKIMEDFGLQSAYLDLEEPIVKQYGDKRLIFRLYFEAYREKDS